MTTPPECGQLPTWYRTRDRAAKDIGKRMGRRTSDRTVRRILFAVKNGCPELVVAMDGDRLSIAAAAELARLDHDYQRRCLADRKLRRLVLYALRGGE